LNVKTAKQLLCLYIGQDFRRLNNIFDHSFDRLRYTFNSLARAPKNTHTVSEPDILEPIWTAGFILERTQFRIERLGDRT
jgi:hypothetical protein